MAVQKIQVNGNDITRLVQSFKWGVNDIDAPNSGRDMTGTMRRGRVAVKAKLQFTCRTMTHDELMNLNSIIGGETVSVSYLDPCFGKRTATFYGSSVESAMWQADPDTNNTWWESPTFNLIEV